MDQSASRRGNQRRAHLSRDLQRGRHVQRSLAAHTRVERLAFDQFHRVVAAIRLLGRAELEYPRHVGVAKRRRRPRLAQETLAHGRARPNVWFLPAPTELDDLQRHGAAQHPIQRLVGYSHRPPT